MQRAELGVLVRRAAIAVTSALFLVPMALMPAIAADTSCRAVADRMVKAAVEDALQDVMKADASLKKLDRRTLIEVAGKQLIAAKRADLKAHGYMTLLWYGDAAAQQMVAEAAAALQTQKERAHFYFVMGLYQIGSKTPKLAQEGRDTIKQVHSSNLVTFVNEATWRLLITDCQMSK